MTREKIFIFKHVIFFLDDGLIVVGSSGHLAGEQGHHLGEVHWAVGLVEHALDR